MNSLSQVVAEGFYRKYNLSTEKPNLIDRLPVEIFMKVFSYLRGSDIQQTCLVSYDWKERSINMAKRKSHFKISKFAKFLGENLPAAFYPTQIKTFFRIATSTTILASRNLSQIKLLTHLQKENILNTLQGLNTKDLNNLKKSCKNKHESIVFNQAFKLANIYKQIDETQMILPDSERTHALKYIFVMLIKNNNINQAIEVAKMIPNMTKRASALLEISKILITLYKATDKAIEVAKMIPITGKSTSAFHFISSILTLNNKFDKAIEVAKMIPITFHRASVLWKISIALTKSNQIDKAIEV